jgi:hypothetical protein
VIPSVLVGSALLLLFSPWMLKLGANVLASKPVAKPAGPGVAYQRAMADLATVRRRLVETKHLDDKVKAAIDTITLALVAGSDQ